MKLRDMVRCAACAALMAVCAWLWVPLGEIAVTMQTFAVFFTLGILGGGKGTVACAAYLLLGAVGLPVFAGFQGGVGVLLGPTGGYLWGFLGAALLYRLLERRLPRFPLMILGMILCYFCGTVWFLTVYTQAGLWAVLLKCVVPYIIPDAVKLTLAWRLSRRLERVKLFQ